MPAFLTVTQQQIEDAFEQWIVLARAGLTMSCEDALKLSPEQQAAQSAAQFWTDLQKAGTILREDME